MTDENKSEERYTLQGKRNPSVQSENTQWEKQGPIILIKVWFSSKIVEMNLCIPEQFWNTKQKLLEMQKGERQPHNSRRLTQLPETDRSKYHR